MNSLPPELDIPVLTDVIDEDEPHHVSAAAAQIAADDADTLQHLEDAIVNRLMVQLSNRIPLLLETALREQLPDMITVRLQTALVAALETVMPAATHSVTRDIASTLAYEIGNGLQAELETEIRQAVAEEFSRL